MESKGTTVVASCIHQALTDSYRYTTLADATGIPDSTSEYDQLVSILSELNDFTAEEDAEASGIKAADIVVQLNTRISLRYRRLLTQLSRDTGKTIRSLVEESLEAAYL